MRGLTAGNKSPILVDMGLAVPTSGFHEVRRALSRLSGLRLLCVDVFDTLLTRAVGEPSSVYLLLGQKLFDEGLIALPPETFARARALAEKRERARVTGTGDIDLCGGYRELAHAQPALRERVNEMMSEELAMEARLIRAVPGALEELGHARNRGLPVAFVSDMYLPHAFLQSQLDRLGFWQPGDRLFVSSACGFMKARDGALFRHVLAGYGLQPHEALHVGNHAEDDCAQARRVGLHTVHVPQANPNRYERALEQHRWSSAGASSLLAGASRMARLHARAQTEHERALVDVAAGVGAPVIVSFLVRTLHQAHAQGIARLYHLSREGQILHRLALILCRRMNLPIENRYLHVSRRAR